MGRWHREGRPRAYRPERWEPERRFRYHRPVYGAEYGPDRWDGPGRWEYWEEYRRRRPVPPGPGPARRPRGWRRRRQARGWPGPERWWHAVGPERRQDYDWAFNAGPPGRYGWPGETGHM